MPQTTIKENRIIIIFCTTFFIISMLSIHPTSSINQDIIKNESNQMFIDGKILEDIKTQSEVSVSVSLRDSSGILIASTDTDKLSLLRQKWKINEKVQLDIILNLTDSEFKIEHISPGGYGFDGKITQKGLDKLRNNPHVLSIFTPTYFHSFLSESVHVINASDVWPKQVNNINVTGKDVTICVIDSGVDYQHPDLNNTIVAQHCFCNASNYGSGGCCPNNQSEDTNAMDDKGHGTHVAGIIVSQNSTYKGIAPDANIAAVKVLDKGGGANQPNIVSAISWCVDHKYDYNISIISMSLGTDEVYNDTSYCDATQVGQASNDAHDAGIFIVAATGNNGSYQGISLPACASNVTSVGAVYKNADYYVTDYSNMYTIVDLLAPGGDWGTAYPDLPYTEIVSLYSQNVRNNSSLCFLYWNGSCHDNQYNVTEKYIRSAGTSMAAPHVSATAALLLQYEKLKNNITLSPDQIQDRLKETGKLTYYPLLNMNFSRINTYAVLFPIDVFDLQRLNASPNYNVFGFKIQNNYNNQTKNVSWSFDIGNGTSITSTQNITLQPKKTVFVYFEYNYTDGDIYTINITASSGEDSDSETMTISLGNLIAYDMKLLNSSSRERIFGFKILNNMNGSGSINWTLNTGQQVINSNNPISLNSSKTAFVYAGYNYTSAGRFTVNATASNGSITDSTANIMIDIS